MATIVQDLSGKAFDYVIIGGGTTGLTLATRLSENPNVTVAVLEAGVERFRDPLIDIPGQYGKHFGDSIYAWDFITVPQVHSNNNTYTWPRGKVLGGSSAINFYVWTKPPAADVDAWETLGNTGWNWARFNEYSKKSESFTPPDKDTSARYRQKYNLEAHGTSGPLKTSFPKFIIEPEVPFQQALLNGGIPLAKNPLDGDPIGTSMMACTIDNGTQTRSYAATAYYLPNAHKANLRVLCGALVCRITIRQHSDTGSSEEFVKAEAVEFEYDGSLHSVLVGKEVVVAAGALKSPQILELSGIGDKAILEPLGIKTIIDLPGVGSNMQEHMLAGIIFELDPKRNFETLDSFFDAAYVEKQLELYKEKKGAFRISVSGVSFLSLQTISFPETAKEIINRERKSIHARIEKGELPPRLREQYKLLLDSYESGLGGECEIICFPGWFGKGAPEAGKNYVTIMVSFNRPFGRGTIHINLKDPHAQPEVDPRYFEEPFDLEVITESMKFIRRIAQLEPFKDIIVREAAPGPLVNDDTSLQEFIKDNLGTTFHTVGTLSMLPRGLDGVVDPKLLVYGTQNIRVADISIVPLHVASHTQSIAYAIGEQAADIIRGRFTDTD